MIVKLTVGGATARVYLTGWRTPKAYAALISKLPATTRARVLGGLLSLKFDLTVTHEGHRSVLCPGEVAYWPPATSIVVTLSADCAKMPSPVSLLGFVVSGLEALRLLAEGFYEAKLDFADGKDVEGPLADA